MSEIFSHNTSDKPREACGVFGLYSRELAGELAQRTYFGLYALQHRGQESAGIAVSDGERTTAVRDMGLVSQVFDEARLAALESGHIALGHVRYSTTGSASWENAQPEFHGRGELNVAVAHNGNLVNATRLRERSEEHTSELQSRQYLVCRLLLEKKKLRVPPRRHDV